MVIHRTPERRFKALPGYPYPPRYRTLPGESGLRMHYVDEGPREGRVILMLHGEPSWSYLYRHMIPIFAEAGCRAVAPDLIGFGRSDKPGDRADYTYANHQRWLQRFIDELGLDRILLVCHDWGGLLGLRLVASQPQRFAAVVATNTFFPDGSSGVPEAFRRWRDYSQSAQPFQISKVLQLGTSTELGDAVLEAYDAPFPDDAFKAGARQFPVLVPIDGDDAEALENRRLWEALAAYDRPFITAFSDGDPITAGLDRVLQDRIAGAAGRPHTTIAGAGHFSPEDRGPELAAVVLKVAAALAETPQA